MMSRKFETLIDEAIHQTDQAGSGDFQTPSSKALVAISYSLIAIAQELHQINEERDLEHYRQERLAGSAFVESG